MLQSANKKGPIVIVPRGMDWAFSSGYGYLAGYLKEKGENVKILFRPHNESEYPKLIQEIIKLKPLLVGFGALYPDLQPTKEIVNLLNEAKRNFPIVIGGQMVSPTPEFAVEVTGADIGVIGEGEIILYNIVKTLRNDKDILKVKGLVINKGKEKILTGPGEYIKDLSELPPIPYELFPSMGWLNIGKILCTISYPHHRYSDRTANIHGGRGCPFTCNFCYHHSHARCRPIEDILKDVKDLVKKFRVNHVIFDDDLAILSPNRAQKLADGMKNIKNLEYTATVRIDILARINDELLKNLKESGLRHLNIGVESGSQRMLDVMNKKITVEQIMDGFKRLKKAEILANASIMIGQYTETNEDVQRSMDLMTKVINMDKNVNWGCSIATPFPGSELYRLCFEKGIFKTHYDFFHSLNKNQAMTGVTANLSAMTDEEILNWKHKFKQTIKYERAKKMGHYTCKIQTQRIRAERFNKRLHERYFDKLPDNIIGKIIKKPYDLCYYLMQVGFDKILLKMLGVKKH